MDNIYKEWKQYTLRDAGLIILVIVLSGIALLIGFNRSIVLVTAGIITAFLLLLIVMYAFNLRKPKQLKKIKDSDLWVHWKYDAGEWQSLTNDTELQAKNKEQAKQWMPSLRQNAIVFTVVLAGLAGFILRDEGWYALISVGIVGGSIFALSYRSALRVKRSLSNPYARSKPEVYISSMGIVYGDNGVLFDQPKLDIEDVEVETEREPSLFHIIMSYQMGNKQIAYNLTIPIPIGRDDEGKILMDHFFKELLAPVDAP